MFLKNMAEHQGWSPRVVQTLVERLRTMSLAHLLTQHQQDGEAAPSGLDAARDPSWLTAVVVDCLDAVLLAGASVAPPRTTGTAPPVESSSVPVALRLADNTDYVAPSIALLLIELGCATSFLGARLLLLMLAASDRLHDVVTGSRHGEAAIPQLPIRSFGRLGARPPSVSNVAAPGAVGILLGASLVKGDVLLSDACLACVYALLCCGPASRSMLVYFVAHPASARALVLMLSRPGLNRAAKTVLASLLEDGGGGEIRAEDGHRSVGEDGVGLGVGFLRAHRRDFEHHVLGTDMHAAWKQRVDA